MKVLFVFLVIGFSMPLLGQSKKKQIEMLTVSKDSIQGLLDKEREAHTLSKTTLTNQNSELNNQINDLKGKSETQNAHIANLEGQLKKIEVQLQVKEQENLKKDNNIQNLIKEIERLKDSLNLIQSSQAIPNPNDIVHIPDQYFKAYLIADKYINTNGDNDIQLREARAFTGGISNHERNLPGNDSYPFEDLTGIEAFTALTSLELNCPNLKILDLSKNVALEKLDISSHLTSLDLSKNMKLTQLTILGIHIIGTEGFEKSPIKSIDLSKNVALEILHISSHLTSLDLSKNTALIGLICKGNQLTSLDLSKNTALKGLICSNNQLTSLDVSKNTALTYLECKRNPLDCVVGCTEECNLDGATRCP